MVSFSVAESDRETELTVKTATSPGGPLYGIAQTNQGLLFFGGGIPLKLNGNFVGAVGVSGGQVDQDVAIANAAVAGLK
jgi:uncharacterized protein GlcG (DUF336 family)